MMTRWAIGTALLLTLLFCVPSTPPDGTPPPANDSLVNGGFTLPLTTGWHETAQDFDGSHEIVLLPDSGVRISKLFCGTAAIYQDVKLVDLNQQFATRCRFSATSNNPDYFSSAYLQLQFQDGAARILGETRFGWSTNNSELRSKPDLHVIPAVSDTWVDLSLNLADEVRANLPAVAPDSIKRVRIQLRAFGSGRSAC
ncbi:MAG: hypothetical protein ABIK44_07540 [candidate division WOR-3 bacterium]